MENIDEMNNKSVAHGNLWYDAYIKPVSAPQLAFLHSLAVPRRHASRFSSDLYVLFCHLYFLNLYLPVL